MPNWLAVIGVQAGSTTTVDKRLEMLEARCREWSSRSADLACQYLLQSKKQAEAALSDPEVVEREAKELDRAVVEELEACFTIAKGPDGSVLESAVPNICDIASREVAKRLGAAGYRIDGVVVQAKGAKCGITWVKGAAAPTAGPDLTAYTAFSKALRAGNMVFTSTPDGQDKDLVLLGKADLYALVVPAGTADARALSTADLLKAAEEKKQEYSRGGMNNTPMGTAGKNACERAQAAFKSDRQRAEYDGYLRMRAVADALATAADAATLAGGILRKAAWESAVRRIAPNLDRPDQAGDILAGYCAAKRPTPITVEACAQPAGLTCRCGIVNAPGSRCCTSCGLPLKVKCPECGHETENHVGHCPECGASVGEAMGKAASLAHEAQVLAARLDFDAAADQLAAAEAAWPGLDQVKEARTKAEQLKRSVANHGAFRSAVRDRRLCEALRLLRSNERVRGIDEQWLRETESAFEAIIKEADELVDQARKLGDRDRAATLCDQALSLCSDHAGASAFLASNPPAKPERMNARVSEAGKSSRVRLTWEHGAPRGSVSYEVAVKPRDASISPVSQTCLDKAFEHEIRPGVIYDVEVVAVRGGVKSPAARAEGVIATPGPRDVSVIPASGRITVSWERLPRGAELVISERSGAFAPVKVAKGACSQVLGGLADGRCYDLVLSVTYRPVGGAPVSRSSQTFHATPAAVDISVGRIDYENGSLRIQTEGATSEMYIVVVSAERYARHAGDVPPDGVSRSIPEDRRRGDGALVVPAKAGSDLFVTVFAMSKDGEELGKAQVKHDTRPPAQIYYDWRVSGLINKRLTFVFRSTSGGVFDLPETKVVCCPGAVPHMSAGHMPLGVVGPSSGRSEYSFDFGLPKGHNLYVEALPADGSGTFFTHSGYQLR